MRLRSLRALALASVFVLPAALPPFVAPALARSGPDSFADLAANLLPAVVNISSSQSAQARADRSGPEVPTFPPGSPFEQFFKDFLDRNHPQGGPNSGPQRRGRRALAGPSASGPASSSIPRAIS